MADLPLGIRINNPGNVTVGTDVWVGQIGEERGKIVMDSAVNGIRMAAINLQTSQTKHGNKTIRELISRWAPPGENPTESYIAKVAVWTGIDEDAPVDVYDWDTAQKILRAIFRFENGPGPEGGFWYSDATMEQGLRKAGLTPPAKPLNPFAPGASRTVRGASVATAGGVTAFSTLAGWLDLPPWAVELLPHALQGFSEQQVAQLVLVLTVIGSLYAKWARADDKRNGRL